MEKIVWNGFIVEGIEKHGLEERIKELLALQNFTVENGELDELSRDAIVEWSRSRISAHRQTLQAHNAANG